MHKEDGTIACQAVPPCMDICPDIIWSDAWTAAMRVICLAVSCGQEPQQHCTYSTEGLMAFDLQTCYTSC